MTTDLPLTAPQVRAARALLDWTQSEVAARTKLGLRTVKRVESGERLTAAADLSIRKTFEDAGVVFIWPGVVEGVAVAAGAALAATPEK